MTTARGARMRASGRDSDTIQRAVRPEKVATEAV